MTYQCEADVLEGLESFATDELRSRFGQAITFLSTQRVGALRFSYTGDLRDLLALRSVIAVYRLQQFDVPRPKALLGHQHFETLIALIDTVQALWPERAFTTLRISAAGEDSTVLTRLKDELSQRTGLTVAPDEADLLLRLRRSTNGDGWEVLVRLSPRPLATRAWRVCNLPGALNATVAYAMMRRLHPRADDVVLNLGCGSGTLLIERLALGPARRVIGCDTDTAALDCARANLTAAGYTAKVRLELWDAGQLPLGDASVHVICADLPFGQLVGSHQINEELYPAIFAEATRVAMPNARMVLITHEVRLLERIAADYEKHWNLREILRVRTGGMTPRIYLFQRVAE